MEVCATVCRKKKEACDRSEGDIQEVAKKKKKCITQKLTGNKSNTHAWALQMTGTLQRPVTKTLTRGTATRRREAVTGLHLSGKAVFLRNARGDHRCALQVYGTSTLRERQQTHGEYEDRCEDRHAAIFIRWAHTELAK